MKFNGKPGVELEFHRFFSRMGNVQIRHKEHNLVVSAGRVVAMLEDMPVSRRHWLTKEAQELADELGVEFRRILGDTIRNLGRLHASVVLRCERNFGRLMEFLPPTSDKSVSEDQRLHALLGLVLSLADTMEPFGFLSSEIDEVGCVGNFLRLFARPFSEHRKLLNESAYQYGHVESRLSPLERYPIIELSELGWYVVPSATMFSKAFPYVVDYSLFEGLKEVGLENRYSAFRGIMQEVYLRALVEDRLPSCICVPERAYGKPQKRGPDLTIIDPSSRRLILVESKSRRMRADTTALMSDEALEENLEDAYSALLKLPEKIRDLYAGLSAYSDVQSHLDDTKEFTPVCVIVLSNLVFGLSEIVRLKIAGDSAHSLREFSYPFCIISLDTFERAVEIARSTGPTLAELLEEHWQVSGTFNTTSPNADMFKARRMPSTEERFAAKYFE